MKFIYINQEKHDVGKIRGLNILWVLLRGYVFASVVSTMVKPF